MPFNSTNCVLIFTADRKAVPGGRRTNIRGQIHGKRREYIQNNDKIYN